MQVHVGFVLWAGLEGHHHGGHMPVVTWQGSEPSLMPHLREAGTCGLCAPEKEKMEFVDPWQTCPQCLIQKVVWRLR